MKHKFLISCLFATLLVVAGCGKQSDSGGTNGTTPDSNGSSDSPAATSKDQSASGAVEQPGENWAELKGRVVLKGEKPESETYADAGQKCKMLDKNEKVEIQKAEVGENGGLKDVFVWVEGDNIQKLKPELPKNEVTIDQQKCRFHPDAALLGVGGAITVKNSDDDNHNFNYEGDWISGNITQDSGAEDTLEDKPDSPQFITFQCNIHPWMSGKIRVADHHAYDLTGKDGSFNLHQVPPGTYTVKVHHKSMDDTKDAGEVTVKEDGSVEGLDLSSIELELK